MEPPYLVKLPKTDLNIQLNNTEIMDRCADSDGCSLVMGALSSMRGGNWLPAFRAAAACRWTIAVDPFSATGTYWTLDDACTNTMGIAGGGIDNNGAQDVVARIYGSTCVLADYPRTGGTYGPDSSDGFSLFYYDDAGAEDSEPDFTCVVSISD
ncbi:MAG: hypothetical protein ACOY3X_06375 [Pseudomonadota bacterium]